MRLIIGTRGSQLALAQAGMVRDQIAEIWPGGDVVLEVVKTTGDHLGTQPLSPGPQDEPVGIFTKELDDALLSGRIRAAIHSLKDVPTQLPAGIVYGALLKREDSRDAFISRSGKPFAQLPADSKVGTSSPRREAQIRAARPDLTVIPLRGNVDTRIRKLQAGELDAIVIAAAGLKRLGREKEATELLSPEVILPAPAQGVLCVTVQDNDDDLLEALRPLDDPYTRICAQAERAFLRTLQGGCRIPVGALARIEGETLFLTGVIANPNGEQVMRESRTGSIMKPQDLGDDLAKALLANGAHEILNGFGRNG